MLEHNENNMVLIIFKKLYFKLYTQKYLRGCGCLIYYSVSEVCESVLLTGCNTVNELNRWSLKT
jgi:hypothetical protein